MNYDEKKRLPKFSVLMSVYIKENPNYFKQSLESIMIKQKIQPDELVLVVDGPVTTELNNVIREFEEMFTNKFFVYRLEKNVGLGNALNYGLKYCNYNIIARADSDDICAPDRFKIQIEEMMNNPEIDICGSYIGEFYSNPENIMHTRIVPIDNESIYKMAKFRNPINHMSVIFKKDKIINIGSYENLPYVEDYYLWVKSMNSNLKFKNIGKTLVFARVGNGMVSRRGNKQYIKSWKVLNTYMLKNKMINRFIYIRNMISVNAFIYMPISVKENLYKYILRKSI